MTRKPDVFCDEGVANFIFTIVKKFNKEEQCKCHHYITATIILFVNQCFVSVVKYGQSVMIV